MSRDREVGKSDTWREYKATVESVSSLIGRYSARACRTSGSSVRLPIPGRKRASRSLGLLAQSGPFRYSRKWNNQAFGVVGLGGIIMPGSNRNYRRVSDRRGQDSDLGWWLSGTFVLTLLVALVVYGVTRPNLMTVNTQPITTAPQANTVGQVPKSDDRVQNPVGAPGTNR